MRKKYVTQRGIKALAEKIQLGEASIEALLPFIDGSYIYVNTMLVFFKIQELITYEEPSKRLSFVKKVVLTMLNDPDNYRQVGSTPPVLYFVMKFLFSITDKELDDFKVKIVATYLKDRMDLVPSEHWAQEFQTKLDKYLSDKE
jgi:hypothetical protein